MTKQGSVDALIIEAKEIRQKVLSMIVSAHASHIASSYSAVDLLVYLYEKILNIDPHKPLSLDRDRFILSKGWGISALYTILARKGFFPAKLLDTYCKDGSELIGIATRNHVPGVEATTGSMGHGLPIGVGMAIAAKLQKRTFRVFVLIGDGECDEGSTWEAALLASHHELDNLTVIIDNNKWQGWRSIHDTLKLEPLADKWRAFNWAVAQINGHNFSEMEKTFSQLPLTPVKPNLIIASTVKGKGVSVLEDKNEWHYKTPTITEIAIAETELKIL